MFVTNREDMQEELNVALRGERDHTPEYRAPPAFSCGETIVPEMLDLNKSVNGMLKRLHPLIGENINLVWLPGAEAPMVHMDTSQIEQILSALCVNARKAITGVGRITIETENVLFDKAYCAESPEYVQGEYALLAVSDDGCGMDRQTLDRISGPFSPTRQKDGDAGRGLASVYDIVRQNDGFITAYSAPGHGATFNIYLPRALMS
ncbi:MAG: sensor histidine kinase [Syntrophobacteraceae bacterium]